MKYILLFICLLSLISCSRKVIPVNTYQNDSIRIEKVTEYIERVRIDTVQIEVPAQTAQYSGNQRESFLETVFAESTARIDPEGQLYHDLKNKPQQFPAAVPVIDTEITQKKDSIVYRDRVKEIPVTLPLTNWQRFWMFSGRVAWGVIILLMFYKGRRFFR